LVLRLQGNGTQNVYAGVMDSQRSPDAIEHGAFAGYMSIATLAYATKATVRCSYLVRDKKERINGLSIVDLGT
jgi:hypothetical protein